MFHQNNKQSQNVNINKNFRIHSTKPNNRNHCSSTIQSERHSLNTEFSERDTL